MVSGRALGHTGGTLDKLESIPGFRTGLTRDEFVAQLSTIGIAMIGQSDTMTPATANFMRCVTPPLPWSPPR